MNKEETIKLIDKYWKFDGDQQPISNWHDKQDLLELLRTQPALSAEEIIDKIIYSQTDGEEYACIKKSDCIAAMEQYRNQTSTTFTQPRPPKEEAERIFHWMCLNTMSDKHDILVVLCELINYTISALQLRGIDTTYEEEVLTILKSM